MLCFGVIDGYWLVTLKFAYFDHLLPSVHLKPFSFIKSAGLGSKKATRSTAFAGVWSRQWWLWDACDPGGEWNRWTWRIDSDHEPNRKARESNQNGRRLFFSGTSSWKFRSFFFLLKLWKNRLSWRTSRKNMDLYRFIYITMDFDAAPWRQYSYPFWNVLEEATGTHGFE